MLWTVAQARQRLAEVLKAASREPQPIYRRDELMAVVVDGGTFEEFEAWRRGRAQPCLAEKMSELRELLGGEELALPSRQDRRNPFVDSGDDA